MLSLRNGNSHFAGDLNAIYTSFFYQVTPGYELIIVGVYPNARFMSATVYDDHLVAVGTLLDTDIVPLTSAMTNPLAPGETFTPNQRYGMIVSFGQPTATTESPGCSIGSTNISQNVLDASQLHSGITWAGSPSLPPGFPAHETGPNVSGMVTLRKYVDIDASPVPEYVIVRSLANGCAMPIQQAIQANIVGVQQTVTSPLLHQDQISAHLQYASAIQPWLDFPPDPLNNVVWQRPSEYIPVNDTVAGYLGGALSNLQIKSLLAGQTYLRIQFQMPSTPSTPCTTGNCSLRGDEQVRFVGLTFQTAAINCAGHSSILSIDDQSLVKDVNGNVNIVAGFGAPQPPNATAANGYTWIDVSSMPNYTSFSGMIIRELGPSSSFQCSTLNVPFKTSAYNPEGGYMGAFAPTVDFPTASQIPATPIPVVRPNSCALVPTQAPQQIAGTTPFQSCTTNNTLNSYASIVGSSAGSGTLTLTATGAWTASSNAGWLQLSAGSTSGTGNATIQFTYPANTNAAAQSGVLTIGGLTFTLTQVGVNFVPIAPPVPLESIGLSHPQGLAVDGSNNVYIADTANNAIKQWSPVTQATATLSSAQSSPAAVAVDGTGNVFIADSGNHAIEELSAANQQLSTLVSGLGNPSGVAVDTQGNIYFSDAGNNTVNQWNTALQQLTTLAGSGLNHPAGVAVDAFGNVYFADSGSNSIKEWTAANGLVTPLVATGLNNPTGLAMDAQGNLYVADTGDNAIKEWNATTQQLTSLVTTGLNNPLGVAVDGTGNIYAADSNDSEIDEYTPGFLALSTGSLTEAAVAGTDSLTAQVLPASIPLTATSNQPWLSITGISGGVINFSFTANTGATSRIAQIMVLGQTVTVTQNADVPATITKIVGRSQSTPEGQPFPSRLSVRVTDAAGNNVQGVSVMFQVVAAPNGAAGTFAASPALPVLSNANGVATAPLLTANGVPGLFGVRVTVGSLTAIFGATITSN
ncbi:MAG TPA: BACON domain-containing carbohydrate-binding protein [Bryobacteraceae bacterium]|nr:BACON domain-containing carbohydrate-binding protein [Bryobacteraceae bacterium]